MTPPPSRAGHARGVALMVGATLLWSIAGIVTRQLELARSFEVTFWRSAFNALALVIILAVMRSPAGLWRAVRGGGRVMWASAACWALMYTNFMLAMTLTTVANVLITMALGPLFTALLARFVLRQRLPARTWVAVAVAGIGLAWMFAHQLAGGDTRHALGMGVALGVPLGAACNWTLMQRAHRHAQAGRPAPDMLVAVLLGATLSALLTLPLAWPWRASPHDLAWLGLLGVVQLAVPCLMAVAASRLLSAPEAALLALLEVLFGVAWVWLGAGEVPSAPVLGGGALVLLALAGNEAMAIAQQRRYHAGQRLSMP